MKERAAAASEDTCGHEAENIYYLAFYKTFAASYLEGVLQPTPLTLPEADAFQMDTSGSGLRTCIYPTSYSIQ